MTGGAFSRSAALLGDESMKRLAAAHVLIVGVGGVGGWCAEALARTGVGRLTLMDDDAVGVSNLNRQCPATLAALGRPKVEAMAERLCAVMPACAVETRNERFTTALPGGTFDVIVDAIDSVDCKAELILAATARSIPLVSSMGAALRTDPTKVCVTRFEKVEGDGLARALRQRFRRIERFPSTHFACVWSRESPMTTESGVKGSLMQVTATFGMCLAAEVIRCLTR